VTEAVFHGQCPKGFPTDIFSVARRKLGMLDAAVSLNSLRVPPANRLEALKGDRKGQHSIRINDQWRICFRWTERGPSKLKLSTITDRYTYIDRYTMAKKVQIVATLPPLHPGEVLREEFLVPLELSSYAVAKACGVPRTRIERIVREELGISADTALRLGRFFGIEPQFWLNLQNRYDLATAGVAIGRALERIPVHRPRAA
jgi:addiction module HigA family antidote